MSSKVKKRAVMIAAVIVLLLAGIYFGVAVYYQSHFLPRTTLNDMDVSGKTQEEVEAMITEEIDGYELVEIPENASGKMTEEDISVDYIYRLMYS